MATLIAIGYPDETAAGTEQAAGGPAESRTVLSRAG